MLGSLTGFTLARTIPPEHLFGILSGAYQVFGGVIRNQSGQIVAHLVNASSAAASLTSAGQIAGLAGQVMNTAQLYKIGQDVSDLKTATAQLISYSQGVMAVSGLTLAASAAGFIFLSRKISQIDHKLNDIAKDVKAIRFFLQSQEKAAVVTALRNLATAPADLDERMRIPLLLNSRQTLGEIHQRHQDQLAHTKDIHDAFGAEEYFTTTALGHALCSAELGMYDAAVTELEEAYNVWHPAAQRIVTQHFLGNDPERFLTSASAAQVPTQELVTWLDFANGSNKGIEWIDTLRAQMPAFRFPQVYGYTPDPVATNLVRKLVNRDRIFQGFLSQYHYYASIKARPSEIQQFIEGLDDQHQIGGCYFFISERPAD